MGRKRAIIVANGRFDDPRLPNLTTPVQDATRLGSVLESREIGAFDDVDVLLDQTESQIRRTVLRLFGKAAADDLLLLYFSGHGVLDDRGLLYFAARDTDPQELRATAVAATFVRQELDFSVARRQVVMLDCCNSGAFGRTKGVVGSSVGTERALTSTEGSGRVVLTASDATQFAWEGDEVSGISDTSLFTRFIVQGLATGAADRDLDGHIGVDELYAYAYDQMLAVTTRQKPVLFTDKQQGTIIIASNPRARLTPAPLPQELLDSLEDRRAWVREGAVGELARLLTTKNPRLVISAVETLQRLRDQDDSRQVNRSASAALAAYEQTAAVVAVNPPDAVKTARTIAVTPVAVPTLTPVAKITGADREQQRRLRWQLVNVLDQALQIRISDQVGKAETLVRKAPDAAERLLSDVLHVDGSNARALRLRESVQRSLRQQIDAAVANALVRAETMTTNELALRVLVETLVLDPSNPIVQRRISERKALIERRQKETAVRARVAALEQRVHEQLHEGEFAQAETDCSTLLKEATEFPEIRQRINALRARISTEAAAEEELRKRFLHVKSDDKALAILEEALGRYPNNARIREQLYSQRQLIEAAERITVARNKGAGKGASAQRRPSLISEDDVIESVIALVREGAVDRARDLLHAAKMLNRIDSAAADWLERRHFGSSR